MIYGDDVTHIVSEEGIASLLLCRSPEECEEAIRGIAGFTDVGRRRDRKMVEKLRERKVIQWPEDLGIAPRPTDAQTVSRIFTRQITFRNIASGSGNAAAVQLARIHSRGCCIDHLRKSLRGPKDFSDDRGLTFDISRSSLKESAA
jgi:hypothetical protein